MNYFKFNGYTSTTFGIRIQSKKIYSAPKYETSAISIPGLDEVVQIVARVDVTS